MPAVRQHSNLRCLESESSLMAYRSRLNDPWPAAASHLDPGPNTDSVGKSEPGIATEALVSVAEPARSLVGRSVATQMFALTVIGLFSMLAPGLA